MNGTYSVLIVDDEEELCTSLAELFSARGINTKYTTLPMEVSSILETYYPDLMLMDLRMPEIGGLDLLKSVRSTHPDLPVIMVSGYGSIDSVIKSMKYGALNFYRKPIDIDTMMKEVEDFLDQKGSRKHSGACTEDYCFTTTNPQMERVYHMVKTAAPTVAPVIITGESGTGKERIAKMIHEMSSRRDKPFVKINCAAIPDSLLESELFGHEAGAFTDARTSRKGKFEIADGGSIFFDEVGDMSLTIQAKLLRVLQEKEFERLGGNQVLRSDVRVIAATNKNFEDLIRLGEFREDLYYRISVINIRMPALRDRKEDLQDLCRCLLDGLSQFYGKNIVAMNSEVMEIFQHHNWPGNIRELKNAIERAVIFCEGTTVSKKDLGSQYQKLADQMFSSALESDVPEDLLVHLNCKVIEDALLKAQGSRQKAADLLHIHRKTLYNRMKKYSIKDF